MKKILLTQRLVQQSNSNEVRAVLDIAWSKLFNQLSVMPIEVAYDIDPLQYFNLDNVGGVLLTGGNDLNSLVPLEINKRRDDLENILLTEAIRRKIPVIGVCRGAEYIAHYFGSVVAAVSGHVTPLHPLNLTSNSNYFSNFYKPNFSVNSFHDFGITKLASTLKAEAIHADGTIEAFIHSQEKIIGIMWHPERSPEMLETTNLFKNFWNIQ